MVDIDYNKTFTCPKCGAAGNIYLAKVAGNKLIVKQRCPVHGGRQFKVPLKDKEKYIDLIQDGVFRCYKCGGESEQSYRRDAKPWTIIKTSCPTHGALTSQKIWGTIYNEISSGVVTTPQPAQPQPIQPEAIQPQPSETENAPAENMDSEDRKFCPNCGAKLEESGAFCGECGSKLN